MAKVLVKVYATTREKFPKGSVEIEGNTLIEVLRNLAEQFPEIKEEILDKSLSLKDTYVYLINGRNSAFLQGEKTLLKNGDKISIFPPVTGG